MARGREDATEALVPQPDAGLVSGGPGAAAALRNVVCQVLVPRAAALVAAMFVYRVGDREYYDAQMSFFSGLAGASWGYVYAAAAVFSLLSAWLEAAPMIQKVRLPGLGADAYVYRLRTVTGGRGPAVLLEDEGIVGEYNRESRSAQLFVESAAAVAVSLSLAGSIFPLPALALACGLALGRCWHQCLAPRGTGQGLGELLALACRLELEMLVLLVALKALGAA